MLQQLILNRPKESSIEIGRRWPLQQNLQNKKNQHGRDSLLGVWRVFLSIHQSNMKNHLLVSSENKNTRTTLNKTLAGELKE